MIVLLPASEWGSKRAIDKSVCKETLIVNFHPFDRPWLFIYLFIYLFSYLFIHLSIYLLFFYLGTKPSQMLETGSTTQGPSKKGISGPPEVSVTLLKNKFLPSKATAWHKVQLPIDFLLLTVKDCEFLSCLSYLNKGFFKSYHKSIGYLYFGDIGKDETMSSKIALMKCYPVPKVSVVAVTKAVKILRPKAVFCVGFCGGLNYRKVKLGDVVVSARLTTYASIKITDSVVFVGVHVPIKTHLADLIRSAGEGWKAPLKDPGQLEVEVHRDGEFLSGPEVVDSKERRDQLINRFPDAIAIEMEGEGKTSSTIV